MSKAARNQFLYKAYGNINSLYNLSEAMLAQFKCVTLTEAVNSTVPYQYYTDLDKSIVNNTLHRLKGLLSITFLNNYL